MDKNNKKRPFMSFLVFGKLPESLQRKWVLLFPHASLSKVKVVGFLTLMFLIVVSSHLMMDIHVFTPHYSQLRPEISLNNTSEHELSSENHNFTVKALANIIRSKLDYSPRKLPEDKDIIRTDPHLYSVIPQHFLPEVKSPCWYEEVSSENSTDPYSRNYFTQHHAQFKRVCDGLKKNFKQHLHHIDGKDYRLRCLPYFYVIGQPKSGTTDLFGRLLLHPDFKYNTIKEPHWWTRKQFGSNQGGLKYPVEDYLDLFDLTAHKIQEGLNEKSSGHQSAQQLIAGEASASTMWDNHILSSLSDDKEETNPPVLPMDLIHKVQPTVKIIIMLRDPTERLYSDYLYFTKANKSAEDFHQKVVESVLLFEACLSERSLHSCVYNTSLRHSMLVRLCLGMYIVYIRDWLTVFPRDQILVLCLEDYSANVTVTIKKVFAFLGAGSLSEEVEAALENQPKFNTRRTADLDVGPMLPATKDLLQEFYKPFNQKLCALLDNKAFLWNNTKTDH